MPATVREDILANIKTSLEAINGAGGYDNDLSTKIQRDDGNGGSFDTLPTVIISAGAEENDEDKTIQLTSCHMSVNLDVYMVQQEDSVTSPETVLNTILGDIKKALKVDITRGGKAVDTKFKTVVPFEISEGRNFSGLMIEIDVHYRHLHADPKTAR